MNFKVCLASLSLLAASFCALAPSASATVASSSETFYFTGTCSDCTGTGQGVLVLQNYTAGTALSTSNFVSFSYTSNLLPAYSFAGDTIVTFNGNIGPGNGPYNVTLFGKEASNIYDELITSTNGHWCLGANCASDTGPASTYSTINPAGSPTSVTPEPATISLLGTGIAAVVSLRRRRAWRSTRV